ncbi:hypothetical protein MNEG_3738 [Monoraphidium neglectum]|uniref:Uncharacterized protein n=1 Tax=Monoraphidium neglectum TaxID=145388 RepID=A0A0D2NGS7_9CHLO|nr:hypothetical protein MNEG_3738 [Monoraphidium neglectum]KIZ04221.1 hypothetical protein MNEG_3738 [Monoraphidium neglectum]|eukprot:XP_013903240.1 hypothetical protein MNEG_3738 [Monoraphidium neglectum]
MDIRSAESDAPTSRGAWGAVKHWAGWPGRKARAYADRTASKISNYTEPSLAARTTTMLTTYALVSGLLTSSTYPAFYADLPVAGEAAGGDAGAPPSAGADAFRFLNGASFAVSLGCILTSTGAMMILNTISPSSRPVRFRSPVVFYLWLGVTLSSSLLVLSILLCVANVAVGAFVFFSSPHFRAAAAACGAAVLLGLGFSMVYCPLITFEDLTVASDDTVTSCDPDLLALVAARLLYLLQDKQNEAVARICKYQAPPPRFAAAIGCRDGPEHDTGSRAAPAGTASTAAADAEAAAAAGSLPLNDVLGFEDVRRLAEGCRSDFRQLQPVGVMPCAFYTPWALAALLEGAGLLSPDPSWRVCDCAAACAEILAKAGFGGSNGDAGAGAGEDVAWWRARRPGMAVGRSLPLSHASHK